MNSVRDQIDVLQASGAVLQQQEQQLSAAHGNCAGGMNGHAQRAPQHGKRTVTDTENLAAGTKISKRTQVGQRWQQSQDQEGEGEEEDGEEDAADRQQATTAQDIVQTQLLQELPVLLDGVPCDLPPAGPELEPRPAEALTPQALCMLAQQDATLYDQHLHLMRFDDALADLASRRGLLVRFHIKSIGVYQAELVVEAPEYMTVEYLKRRVVKAKLQRGDKLLSTARFVLRKRLGAGGSVGEATRGTEELPSATSAGDEVFLFHLGYRAPGPYELYIATAPQTSDREQQEAMLASLITHAQEKQHERQQAAATVTAASMAAQPAEVIDARLTYQALLRTPASVSVVQQQQQQRSSPGASQMNRSARSQQPLVIQAAQAAAAAGATAAACNHVSAEERWEQHPQRRRLGRWMADEVAALIAGVQAHGTRWSSIYEAYVHTGRINPGRSQVNLKDKWRNLVKLACNGRQARSTDLTEEQRQIVWSIVHQSNGTPKPNANGVHAVVGNASPVAVSNATGTCQVRPQQQQQGTTDSSAVVSEGSILADVQQQQEHDEEQADEQAGSAKPELEPLMDNLNQPAAAPTL